MRTESWGITSRNEPEPSPDTAPSGLGVAPFCCRAGTLCGTGLDAEDQAFQVVGCLLMQKNEVSNDGLKFESSSSPLLHLLHSMGAKRLSSPSPLGASEADWTGES
jgi:hypothetical protein